MHIAKRQVRQTWCKIWTFCKLWVSIVWSLRQSFYVAFVLCISRVSAIDLENISSGKCTLLVHHTYKIALVKNVEFGFCQLWASIAWSLRQSFWKAFGLSISRVCAMTLQNIISGKCTLLTHQADKLDVKFWFFVNFGHPSFGPYGKAFM